MNLILPAVRWWFCGLFAMALLLGGIGCSSKADSPLYGKWNLERVTMTSPNRPPLEQPAGPKIIEFRKDGTYVEGEKNGRVGKYQFVDANNLRIEIDGLVGDPKIVLQGDTLDICNPDGSTIEHYRRVK
jgi:hypothetical protein